MNTQKNKIPLADYKVLLIQLIMRLLERLVDTGLKPTSKRAVLLCEAKEVLRKLERELKRDVTLRETAEHKKDLWDSIYQRGAIPRWLLLVVIEAITEETTKVNK